MEIDGKPFYILPTYRNSVLASLVSVLANLCFILIGAICVVGGVIALGDGLINGFGIEGPMFFVGIAVVGVVMCFVGLKLRDVAENIAINKYKKQQQK